MTDAIKAALWNEFSATEQAANAPGGGGADHAAIYKDLAERYGVTIQEVHTIISDRTTDTLRAG